MPKKQKSATAESVATQVIAEVVAQVKPRSPKTEVDASFTELADATEAIADAVREQIDLAAKEDRRALRACVAFLNTTATRIREARTLLKSKAA